jgi:hypothetical protein
MIAATAGEIIMCENGHPMYEMLVDANVGDAITAASMRAIGGNPGPLAGVAIPLCAECGKSACRVVDGQAQIFVDGQWRKFTP